MSRLGEKGVKIQKNWSLMVSFVRLCASTEPTTQTRKVRHQNTLWERMRSYRLISQTPAVFAACPVFKSNKNQNVFKRVSLNPKRDDLDERGNETMVRNTLSFALFISQHEALLLCLRTIRRAKRVLLSSKTTTRNKSSYLSPYAHRPDHSLTLSLSKMTKESPWCFPFQNGQC